MNAQAELALPGIGLSAEDLAKATKILNLLETVTSLSVVGEFLRQRNLPHASDSWEELREKRMLGALRARRLAIGDLSQLLAECEEYRRSHVFLYTCRRREAEQFADRARMTKVCQQLGLEQVLAEGLIEEIPSVPTFTQIREQTDPKGRCWVFKVVESRRERRFLSETEEGNRLRREWEFIPVRAVNVACLHETGLLELRVQGHWSSTQYQDDLDRFWEMIKDFLPPGRFAPFSLAKAKAYLWANRASLKHRIRFSDSRMRNNAGTTLTASTGAAQADLFEDSGAAASLDRFLDHGAHCDSSNVWWRPVEGVLTREVHTLLSGLSNEFAVTASCTRSEYEYILNELRVYCR
ncbi:MAG: hypothetical protein U1G07_08310 [Verrucomicrobiota bacterium]